MLKKVKNIFNGARTKMGEIINRVFGFISGLFKIDSNVSSQRFAFLFAVVISNLSVFGVWAGLSIAQKSILTIPESVIVVLALSNGLSMSSKLIQKTMEKTDKTKEDVQ